LSNRKNLGSTTFCVETMAIRRIASLGRNDIAPHRAAIR